MDEVSEDSPMMEELRLPLLAKFESTEFHPDLKAVTFRFVGQPGNVRVAIPFSIEAMRSFSSALGIVLEEVVDAPKTTKD
jgi:hypothetical protein